MGSVVDIEENMPHFGIQGHSGNYHVIPVVTIERIANGSLPLLCEGQEECDKDMIRGIILEWLELKGA